MTCYPPKPTIKIPTQPYTITPHVAILEHDLMASIAELHLQHWIFGDMPSLEDLLDPAEEKEIGDSPYQFEGADAEIVAEVYHQMAVYKHNIVDVDSEDEHKAEEEIEVSVTGIIEHCHKLEGLCLKYSAECLICFVSCTASEDI